MQVSSLKSFKLQGACFKLQGACFKEFQVSTVSSFKDH